MERVPGIYKTVELIEEKRTKRKIRGTKESTSGKKNGRNRRGGEEINAEKKIKENEIYVVRKEEKEKIEMEEKEGKRGK